MDKLITADGVEIDMTEKIPVPLNLSIADFKHPEKRQRNFTKEIELPGTSANMRLFGSAFNLTEVSGSFNFNASAKLNCTYYKRSTPILPNAVLKLNSVVVRKGLVVFKVGLFSDFVDIFLLLSNISVRDLGWSEYSHALNNPNIIASWSSAVGSGYYYPLIERKQRPFLSSWRNIDMIPYVYLVEVFKKCMEYADQKYSSEYLNSDSAKKILFGFGGGEYVDAAISPAEQNTRKVLTDGGVITFAETRPMQIPYYQAARGFAVFGAVGFTQDVTVNEVQDNLNQMAGTSFEAARSGSMKLEIIGSIRIEYTSTDSDFFSHPTRTLQYSRNGVFFPIVDLVQTSENQLFTLNVSADIGLQQGDEVEIFLSGATVGFTWTPASREDRFVDVEITAPTPLQINFISTQNAITEGSTVEIGRFLPDMKASEFLLGAIRLCNLMVSDPDIYGVVRVEPLRDFYQGTDVHTDISQEIDRSKDIEIRPSANEYAKTLSFKFKEATETDAKKYAEKWGHNYGDLQFDQSSFFAKGEQKIELPFATVVPFQIYGNVVVPRFIDIDESSNIKPTKGAPRIMFRNGLKAGAWSLVKSGGQDNLTAYPSVHHFDNWQGPKLDLNFRLVDELFYAATSVTTRNTYSEFYERFIKEVISPDGKYVQLYRKLNSLQIQQLDWSKLLMWNGALFRFNKIIDFDSEVTEVTKIEMLKVLEAKNVSGAGATTPVAGGSSGRRYAYFESPSGVGTGVPAYTGGDKQTLKYSNIFKG